MTEEELESLERLLTEFLGYDVCGDLMLEDEVTRLLEAVKQDRKQCNANPPTSELRRDREEIRGVFDKYWRDRGLSKD